MSAAGDAHRAWRARAGAVVAATASTGSKRPAALYGATDDADAPLHFTHAAGCRVTTVGGETLVDLGSGLGAVALGYADPEVTRRACAAAAAGAVSLLTHADEVTLAERLVDLIPCAERVLFLKSGAEAVAAAVRLARAATGRDAVVGSGYFGWLDWWGGGPGITAGAHADFVAVPFDDVAALEAAVDGAGDRLAAIVLEPVVERLPSVAWLRAARRLCDRAGAVLIFDEVKTGCRLHAGGFQATADAGEVLPDVATFGKALANGWPLSAVVGRRAVMDAARRAWVSSTLASEATALAAAHAVLDRHAEIDVCARLRLHGESLQALVAEARDAAGAADVALAGIPAMWFLRFGPDAERGARREARFLDAARAAGVLFKRGAYNYPTLAHDASVDGVVAAAARAGFDAVRALDEEEA
ncbi:aminotransferase class III-fold pyridoxal phosphate-dependent enzyme [Roseisolibacter sp. H3M3-2]|uniref:aminotransferase class III-fold pyridoxal phosphate-dependent enzyme n=1 Tax=Roseisolibacter sp. H3M3-2 TaxID=3031323 RepID=UPI0023DA3A62|nr:aminotransferase class III-fold pyridoxal phosphate-dependent enzyme [Roseisolibacter sp. H3M3-2]MDF1503490.1 aminotransferase class III-fold pyridoxal phosphate-dependent enzyme [Roseisolibacter sp. H3M3-2]